MIQATSPQMARPGDPVFFHTTGLAGKLIRTGQRVIVLGWWGALKSIFRRPQRFPLWDYNHVGMLDHYKDGDWVVNQATGKGTVQAPLRSIAPGGSYIIVSLTRYRGVGDAPIDRKRTWSSSREMLGEPYGFVSIASIIVNHLTPRWIHVDFTRAGTLICSAYAARAMEHGGFDCLYDPFQIPPCLLLASSEV